MSERIGPVQTRVMLRARSASQGHVATADYLEARACRHLVRRGLLVPVLVPLEAPAWCWRPAFRSVPEVYRIPSEKPVDNSTETE